MTQTEERRHKTMNARQRTLMKALYGGTVMRQHRKVGRNEACPCGSSAKYKNCCLRARAVRFLVVDGTHALPLCLADESGKGYKVAVFASRNWAARASLHGGEGSRVMPLDHDAWTALRATLPEGSYADIVAFNLKGFLASDRKYLDVTGAVEEPVAVEQEPTPL